MYLFLTFFCLIFGMCNSKLGLLPWLQVVHDGDQYKPVVGGFNSGPIARKGFFEQQFNLDGEYKFVR